MWMLAPRSYSKQANRLIIRTAIRLRLLHNWSRCTLLPNLSDGRIHKRHKFYAWTPNRFDDAALRRCLHWNLRGPEAWRLRLSSCFNRGGSEEAHWSRVWICHWHGRCEALPENQMNLIDNPSKQNDNSYYSTSYINRIRQRRLDHVQMEIR